MQAALATKSATDFPIFKTIKLGTCKTPERYRDALKRIWCKICYGADDILGKTTCVEEETEVDLVVCFVSELGFNKNGHLKDICAKGVEMGLELCPAEVGPALRLAYRDDQPYDEWLSIAMEAIAGSDGYHHIFAVNRDRNRLSLSTDGAHPESVHDVDSRFVFVKPR
jgi:hypothetical protein